MEGRVSGAVSGGKTSSGDALPLPYLNNANPCVVVGLSRDSTWIQKSLVAGLDWVFSRILKRCPGPICKKLVWVSLVYELAKKVSWTIFSLLVLFEITHLLQLRLDLSGLRLPVTQK